jgi:hypothetical protein
MDFQKKDIRSRSESIFSKKWFSREPALKYLKMYQREQKIDYREI